MNQHIQSIRKDHEMKRKAEKYYKTVVNDMYKRIGKGVTYNDQLEKIGKKMFKKKFRGVFASDKIPELRKGDLLIANLDKSYEKGSHWVGIGRDRKDGIVWVYDSFGRNIHHILPGLWEQQSRQIEIESTEKDAEQKLQDDDCGARSLAFLQLLHKHGSKWAYWV